MDRIPPGQVITERFPILTYGEEPQVSTAEWRFALTGLVQEPFQLNYQELLQLPQVELTRDFHCVTRWSRLDVAWKGVRVKDLLERARPKPQAVAALVRSYGGYTTNLFLEDLLREDVLLAHTLFGKPLPLNGVGRYAFWCPTSTPGKAPSGCGPSSFWTTWSWVSGRSWATTSAGIPGGRSASRRSPSPRRASASKAGSLDQKGFAGTPLGGWKTSTCPSREGVSGLG